jgi:phosphate/sulfate permease
MGDLATTVGGLPHEGLLEKKMKPASAWISGVVVSIALLGGLAYIGFHVAQDMSNVIVTSIWPFLLLGVALLIALGFEFVNGFHDTANAVATVIYTHSLDPNIAVVWSGLCNLCGVLVSSGAVAYSVITLLPVELILQVSYGAGFAMVFALLVAAILWNLGTWWLGLPASSSHTMIGSIIGVGVANQLMNAHSGTSGVDWGQAANVFRVLLISPIVGFGCAFLLFLLSKALVKYPALYEAPKDNTPPPWPIRGLLILTCSGVSFSHGSNDGQKGMGLIMLILIGTVPTVYALNHAVTNKEMQTFIATSQQADQVINAHVNSTGILGADPRSEVTAYIASKQLHGNHHGRRQLRAAGFDDSRAQLRRCGDDGREQERIADLDHSQHRGGVGIHATCGRTPLGHSLLLVPAHLRLISKVIGDFIRAGVRHCRTPFSLWKNCFALIAQKKRRIRYHTEWCLIRNESQSKAGSRDLRRRGAGNPGATGRVVWRRCA